MLLAFYKVTGTFAAPEAARWIRSLLFRGRLLYITVQRPDQPEVQTCCVVWREYSVFFL